MIEHIEQQTIRKMKTNDKYRFRLFSTLDIFNLGFFEFKIILLLIPV